MNNIAKVFARFAKQEEGMVTVEWVALSAAVTIGGIAIGWAVLDALDPVADSIGKTLDGVDTTAPKAPTFGNGTND